MRAHEVIHRGRESEMTDRDAMVAMVALVALGAVAGGWVGVLVAVIASMVIRV